MTTENDPSKKYISFFQAVTTVGIVTKGKCLHEASEKAKERMKNGEVVSAHFNQTPFELSETEEWTPDMACDIDLADDAMKGEFLIAGEVKQLIARKLQKPIHEVTEEDCTQFVLQSIHNSLFHRQQDDPSCEACHHSLEQDGEDSVICRLDGEDKKTVMPKRFRCEKFSKKSQQ